MGRVWVQRESRMGGTFYPKSMVVAGVGEGLGNKKGSKMGGTFYPRSMAVAGGWNVVEKREYDGWKM